MNNFVITLNAGTPELRNAITNYLNSQGWAYWHWIDDFWIVQAPHNYTAKSLHIELEREAVIGTPTMLVFEFEGNISYWGRNNNEAWNWLNHIGNPSL